jgi:acyl-CoA reductase-like NAD-dependent aldehyde dehydrogenase
MSPWEAALITPLNFPIVMTARKVRFLTSTVGKKSLLTVHKPLTVAAFITPWNFPIVIPARKVRFLRSPAGKKILLNVHEPLGVAVLIAPWNFPYWHASQKGEVFNIPLWVRRAF